MDPSGNWMMRQQRDVRAWHQTRLHQFILHENRKQYVTRKDHCIMAKILVAEARRADSNLQKNRAKWTNIYRAVGKESEASNSIMSIAADPYASIIAKLSSMMLWSGDEDEVRCWTFRYNEAEMGRRRASLTATLAQLSSKDKPAHVDPATQQR